METRPKPNEQTLQAEERYLRYLKRTGRFFQEPLYKQITSEITPHFEADLIPEETEGGHWKPVFHPDEIDYSHAKKLWTDAVSEIDAIHHKSKEHNRQLVIGKLERLGFNNPASVLDACITLMQEHSRIVVAFDCPSAATDFHLRNMHEFAYDPQDRSYRYKSTRANAEKHLFSYLKNAKEFFKSKRALPRYGMLFIPDNTQPVDFAKGYGRSFAVLRPAILPGSLYFYADSVFYANKFSRPCSYFNFEFLLSNCADVKLNAIALRAVTGIFPADFNQNWSDPFGGQSYTEVLVPVVSLISSHDVEHLHLDARDIALSEKDLAILRQAKLTVTYQKDSPYPQLQTRYFNAIGEREYEELNTLVKSHPVLLTAVNQDGKQGIEIAMSMKANEGCKILVRHGAKLPDEKSAAIVSNPAFYAYLKEIKRKHDAPVIWVDKKEPDILKVGKDIASQFKQKIDLYVHPLLQLQRPIKQLLVDLEQYKQAISIAEKWETSISAAMIAWLDCLNLAKEKEAIWLQEILAAYIKDIFTQIENVSTHHAKNIRSAMAQIKTLGEPEEQKETYTQKFWGAMYLEKFNAAVKEYTSSSKARLSTIANIRAFLSGEDAVSQIVIIGKLLFEAERVQLLYTAQIFKTKIQSDLAILIYTVIESMGVRITPEQRAAFIGEYKAFIFEPVVFFDNKTDSDFTEDEGYSLAR